MTTRTQICQTLSRSLARRVVKQIPRGLLLGGAILVAGCDDSAEQRKPGPTPAVPAVERSNPPPAKPTRPATGSDTPATPPPVANPTPTGSAPDIAAIVRTYSGCYTDCFAERSKTNRETCKLTCDAAAEATIDGIPGAPSKDTFKAATASFTGCVNSCYADKTLNSTNRATCVLTCQDAAEVAASSALGK
ncbi:hypothetical protein [Nannocystis radixulma]|uniref:Uncharacterized protein n=1 Tax=Nannocystis radixulma TaxID=2995305 RepID=A0ABT5B9H6_9BACT|nr:hypothetical protein [Nannocystis radixulma]MDC0670787.1 hypothetical protein [Nannocystis radixulma]